MLPLTAHPELHTAYPPQTLACILSCVVLTEERLGSAAPVFWEVAASLDRLSGRALMTEEDLPSSLVLDAYEGWIRPTISCDLPPQSPAARVPASLRRLVLHDGVLVSRQTNDVQMTIRDAEDAGAWFMGSRRVEGGHRFPQSGQLPPDLAAVRHAPDMPG